MLDWQIRQAMLLGQPAMEILKEACVAVVGIGGVGSGAAEALARAGVGKLVFADFDTVSQSSINRQLCALSSTIGQNKAEVMVKRARDINPLAQITALPYRYEPQNRETLFSFEPHYIIDAIDLVTLKLDLIEASLKRGVPIISAMGTGNKLDPTLFEIDDISKTKICPLCRVMRKELKKRDIFHHRVLFSTEEPIAPTPMEDPPEGRRSIPGSVSWVPAVAGMMLAGAAIMDILKRNGISY